MIFMTSEPVLLNIGVFQIGAVSNNSVVVTGDYDSGDSYSVEKYNQGFGAVLGNHNAVFSNLNCIYDPDAVEQNAPQNRFEPSITAGPSF